MDKCKTLGPYSQALVAGPWLFLSGQIPIDPKTGQLVLGDITIQTERVMQNIGAILRDYGRDFHHVVKAGIFLKDMDHFASVNEVYKKYFKEPFPARFCVAVKDLPKGADIEIEVIAFSADTQIKDKNRA